MTYSDLCKSYGFKSGEEVAAKLGRTVRTCQNWFNCEEKRKLILIPNLERLSKEQSNG